MMHLVVGESAIATVEEFGEVHKAHLQMASRLCEIENVASLSTYNKSPSLE